MKKYKNHFINCSSLIVGICLPFAFAPFYWCFIAPLAMAALFVIWQIKSSSLQAVFRGWLFGLGMFGVGVSWVYISIHRFGGTNIPLALIITFLFIAGLALFPAVQGYILNRFKRSLYINLLSFSFIWVLFEWIRSWLFTGFPWLFLGYSQTNSWLRGYAPLLGVYGVSFFIVLTGGLIGFILMQPRKWKRNIFIGFFLVVIWTVGGWLTTIHWTKRIDHAFTVSLVQGNIPQQMKWTHEQIIPTLNRYKQLTQKHWKSNIIVWPEAAVPIPLKYAKDYINILSKLAKKHHTTLILGIPVESTQQPTKFYNAAISIGMGDGVYYKRHLVPFGEYLPFEKWLRGLINFFNIPMSDFIAGSSQQKLLVANGIKIGLYICYEVAYPALVKSDLPKAQLLITISNDAWFGDSFAAWQHLQMGQMESIITGRYMLFVTNNGVTAIIAPNGKIIKRLPRFKIAVLSGKIYPMEV